MSRIRSLSIDLFICALCILAGIASRELMIANPNFKPVAALCIASGLLVSRVWLAVLVPVLMIAVSDWRLGGSVGVIAIAVQAALIGNLLIFRSSKRWLFGNQTGLARSSVLAIFLVLAGSLQFFVTTNFLFWLGTGWYDRSFSGLMQCFVSGIPFLWRTLASDLVFAAAPIVGCQILASLGFGFAGQTPFLRTSGKTA